MTHWLWPVAKILSSESVGLRELAASVGGDPAIFYVNQNLAGCDLRGQDLRGMDLTGTHLNLAKLDEQSQIDPEFDPRFRFEHEYLDVPLSSALRSLVSLFAEETGYRYHAWAFKRLIELGVYQIGQHDADDYFYSIINNRSFLELVLYEKSTGVEVLQVYLHQQEIIHGYAYEFPRGLNTYGVIMLIGLLSWKIDDIKKADYKLLEPADLFPTGTRARNI